VFFTRLYDRRLAQASYIIGCQSTGQAIVIDPNRDVAQYMAAAAAERLRITHVTETHIHADFVSGARELAQRTNAQLLLSGEGGNDWQYAYASSAGARILNDGDEVNVGNLLFRVLHTPGHTPEHLAFVLTDLPSSPHPVMVFTGDFVFVGDVGRPDLLEKAAKQQNTMQESARLLFRSLDRFRSLPDHLQLQPGHGAGSACGKALGAVPSSTVGYEKLVNWALQPMAEELFVKAVLEGQNEPPAYFARMKTINRDGPAAFGDLETPVLLSPASAREIESDRGVHIVDLRPSEAFSAGHAPGAINIPLNRSFTTYAGSVLNPDPGVVLVTAGENAAHARDAARELALIGIDRVQGYISADALAANGTATLERSTGMKAIGRRAEGAPIIDVRNLPEWETGHVAGAQHIPFPQLLSRMEEIPRTVPVLVMCQTGARSAIAASMLKASGYQVADGGGIAEWESSGGSTTRE
jgi:hydroxyacylglutathione hydrolase